MYYKQYSAYFRVWHWLNALAMLGLLGTVLLRKTFLSYKTNSTVLVEELAKLEVTLALDDAKAIAKVIREPMWDWHYVFGWALVILLIVRVVLHFVDRAFFNKQEFTLLSGHQKKAQLLYSVVYLFLFIMTISGVTLYFKSSLGLDDNLAHNIKEFHEMLMYFFAFFVPLHILAAFAAENREEPGIVSNMINGRKGQ